MVFSERKCQLRGEVTWSLQEGSEVLWTRKKSNLIVDQMIDLMAELMDPGGSAAAINWLGFGDGTSTPIGTQTQLDNEHITIRAATGSTTVSSRSTLYTFQLAPGSAFLINEMGLFNHVTTLTEMRARVLTQGFTIQSGQTLDIGWEIFYEIAP